MIKVSVVIPVYNVEKYLRECLDSVLGQTLKEIEVIAVNDGSKDGSLKILQEYAARDARLKVIDKANAGVSAARNDAIEVAQGEYLAFMDSDDYYPTIDTLEKMYTAAKVKKAKLCGGTLLGSDEPWAAKFNTPMGFTRYLYAHELFADKSVRFPALKCFEDPVFFTLALAKAGGRLTALDFPTYYYRVGYKQRDYNANDCQLIIDYIEGVRRVMRIARKNRLFSIYRFVWQQMTWDDLRGLMRRAPKDNVQLNEAYARLVQEAPGRIWSLIFRVERKLFGMDK